MPRINLTNDELEDLIILIEEQELSHEEPWVELYDKLNKAVGS